VDHEGGLFIVTGSLNHFVSDLKRKDVDEEISLQCCGSIWHVTTQFAQGIEPDPDRDMEYKYPRLRWTVTFKLLRPNRNDGKRLKTYWPL